MNFPQMAPALAKLDDQLGRGTINPVKKWWWDIELDPKAGRYVPAGAVNMRGLSTEIDLKYEDQTLAVYPADVIARALPDRPAAEPGGGDRPLPLDADARCLSREAVERGGGGACTRSTAP